MGGQLDGNFLPGSLPHKFILIVTLMICFAVNKFLSLSHHPACVDPFIILIQVLLHMREIALHDSFQPDC